MSEYTPTTEEVLSNIQIDFTPIPDGRTGTYGSSRALHRSERERWLAAHDREVAAKALTDAAEHITDDYLKRALLARAAALGVPEEAEHG